MELIILGSGTAMPMIDRSSPAMTLIINGKPVLFDCGPGTMRQLGRVGIQHQNIGHIFITHFHPDHTAGLIHLLFATRNPAVLSRRGSFTISGPKGIISLVEALQDAYGSTLDLPADILRVRELRFVEQESFFFNDFELAVAQAKHSPESLAYRVEDRQGGSMVYSGDTGFCEEVIQLARGVDLLVLECSFPDDMQVDGHLTPSSAGLMAAQAGVKRLLLTHFYPECLGTDIADRCRKFYGGELILGRDLLTLSI